MNINLPSQVNYIIDKIYENNYEAYIVGGCVRDYFTKSKVNDYDITTSATPEDILDIFKDFRCIENGVKHGTVGVIIDEEVYEITTYRIEGEYKDHRRPDKVDFTSNLAQDLQRRDFTINAMAYNKKEGLVDLFLGREDIQDKIIRTVGNPYKRFEEDGLRMIRAIRFASQLGFKIEDNTLLAIYRNSNIIKNISLERITDELNKILLSDKPENIILLFETKLLNHINISKENNDYKIEELKQKLSILNKSSKNLIQRLILLDYIIEKYEINCKRINESLIYSNKIRNNSSCILELIKNINFEELDKIKIKRILSKIDKDIFKIYIDIARNIYNNENKINEIINIVQEIEENNECYKLKDLKINGKDVIDLGYKNKEIGDILNYLLEEVIKDKNLNKTDLLIKKIKNV